MKKQHYPSVGLETARKVGWAKYYEARDEVRDLRRVVRRLCEGVLYDSRFRRDDDLVVLAIEMLKSISQKSE